MEELIREKAILVGVSIKGNDKDFVKNREKENKNLYINKGQRMNFILCPFVFVGSTRKN